MKRIVLVLTVAAMMVAMTLGITGSAIAQDGAPSAEDIMRDIGFYADPNVPGCWFAPGGMYVCAE